MKRDRTLARVLAVAALATLPAMGCTAQAKRDRSPEERETPPAGRQQGSDEAPSASEVAQDVKDAAQEAADKAKAEAEKLGPKVDAAKQVADVKLALMADPNVDGSAIDVDAEEATKTLHLKGTVPTAAQKTAAERIARDKAEGWKIHNMLTVARKS
jgi:osmotically-inducible protein OsmY